MSSRATAAVSRFAHMPYNQPMHTLEESLQFTRALSLQHNVSLFEDVANTQGEQMSLWHIWRRQERKARIIMQTPTSGNLVPQYTGADYYFNRRGQLVRVPFDRLGAEELVPVRFHVVRSVALQPLERSKLLRSLEKKRLEIILLHNGAAHLPLTPVP